MLPKYMLCYPTVFSVGKNYSVFVPFNGEVIMWVKIGDRVFYDHTNGVLRSNTRMHRVDIPAKLLNEAREYTVVYKKMTDRRPYFPISEPEISLTVAFRPVPEEGNINIYQIADAHNLVNEPISAGSYFKDELHLLVLNGDIPNHSGDIENFNAICEIASGITRGEVPVVFARGNHDTRGIHAEDMPNYIPTVNGKTYYTFRVGCLWGMVLDCGEDKDDAHPEYGGTVCFHQFRSEQTEFIKDVIENAEDEYRADGVKYKLIVSHVAFTRVTEPPFDIEKEMYSQWAALLHHSVKPDLMIHGHAHILKVSPKGSDFDHLGQPCTVVIGSKPVFSENGENSFAGCAVTFNTDGTKRIIFNDDKGNIIKDQTLI